MSSRTSTAGSTITLAFDTSARTYRPTDPASNHWRRFPVASKALRYIKTVRRKNSPESTSRRSVAQATDSTRRGWMAKKSVAAIADRRSVPSANPAAWRSKRCETK